MYIHFLKQLHPDVKNLMYFKKQMQCTGNQQYETQL